MLKKKKNLRISVANKMATLTSAFPIDLHNPIRLLASSLIADVPIVFHYDGFKNTINELILSLSNSSPNVYFNNASKLGVRPSEFEMLIPISVMLPDISMPTSADKLFNNPYETNGDIAMFSESLIAKVREKLEEIEFPEDVLSVAFEISKQLTTTFTGDFRVHKLHLIKNVIKAFAFIYGHKVVVRDDLLVMGYMWTNPDYAAGYISTVENFVMDYASIAQAYTNTITAIRSTFQAAKAAVMGNHPINHFDDSIDSSFTLDDVITKCITDASVLEAEVNSQLDGKKENRQSKPMFEVATECRRLKGEFAAYKGVKV